MNLEVRRIEREKEKAEERERERKNRWFEIFGDVNGLQICNSPEFVNHGYVRRLGFSHFFFRSRSSETSLLFVFQICSFSVARNFAMCSRG